MKSQSILAGWLVDGSGGPVRENILLNIHDGVIAQVEEATPEKIRSLNVTDFSHCTLLPGLIDAHIHLKSRAAKLVHVRLELHPRMERSCEIERWGDELRVHIGRT